MVLLFQALTSKEPEHSYFLSNFHKNIVSYIQCDQGTIKGQDEKRGGKGRGSLPICTGLAEALKVVNLKRLFPMKKYNTLIFFFYIILS